MSEMPPLADWSSHDFTTTTGVDEALLHTDLLFTWYGTRKAKAYQQILPESQFSDNVLLWPHSAADVQSVVSLLGCTVIALLIIFASGWGTVAMATGLAITALVFAIILWHQFVELGDADRGRVIVLERSADHFAYFPAGCRIEFRRVHDVGALRPSGAASAGSGEYFTIDWYDANNKLRKCIIPCGQLGKSSLEMIAWITELAEPRRELDAFRI